MPVLVLFIYIVSMSHKGMISFSKEWHAIENLSYLRILQDARLIAVKKHNLENHSLFNSIVIQKRPQNRN